MTDFRPYEEVIRIPESSFFSVKTLTGKYVVFSKSQIASVEHLPISAKELKEKGVKNIFKEIEVTLIGGKVIKFTGNPYYITRELDSTFLYPASLEKIF